MVETRGRKPLLPNNRKPPQATLKINEIILPFVKELKGNLKNGLVTPRILQGLFDVLKGNTSDNEIRLKFVQKYDQEHLKVVKLEGNVQSLKSTVRSLRSEINTLKDKENDCQALKSGGGRCTRSAKVKKSWHGVEINVCLQHYKKVT